MDDLLVILLSVVFILAGIFGQKNKKKNMVNSDSVVKEPPKEDLWGFLEGKWEDSSMEEVSPDVVVDVPAPKQERIYQFQHEQESQRILKKGSFKSISEKKKVRSVKKSRFPLKDAVIYSEILNRKYV